MRILFISIYYYPDGGAAAPLFTMLCEALVQRGHAVTVVTSVPHYPSGRVLDDYQGWSIRKTIENGVCVIRLPVPSVNRKSLIARLWQFVIYQVLATISSLKLEFDVLVSHTSALEVWLPFMVNAGIRRRPSIYSVHDIYPDVGIKLGIFKGKFIISLFTWLEKNCLSHARIVRVLSNSFKTRLNAFGVPETKVHLIYDWVDGANNKFIDKRNSFSSEYSLNDTFNVVYAGNMGAVQGLEIVLETAALLHKEKDIRFVLVGDGSAKSGLVEKTKKQGLSNVLFIPYQARDKMPEVWASADAALVVLRKGTGFGALPSKTFSIMASGRPLLVSVDENSDTWNLVERARAGLCVPPEDPARLAQAILRLRHDPELCAQLGKNGRAWAEENHSPQAAAEKFEKLFAEIVSR